MRIAYVGLSSPIGYDYKNPARKTINDLSSSPNPIIESPFGLCLLFDEIWFINRSFCPDNMRDLSYIRFLDEENILPRINQETFNELTNTCNSENFGQKHRISMNGAFERHTKVCNMMRSILTKSAIDNHTHRIQLGDVHVSGNPLNVENFIFDLAMANKINKGKIELITNSVTQGWLDESNQFLQSKLTEQMIIGEIPNYLTSKGPYHPCIEEVRENDFLCDFRRWIDTKSINANQKEINEMVRLAQEEINKSRDEIFIKHLNPKSQYMSIGKTVLGDVATTIVPGLSFVLDGVEIIGQIKTVEDNKKKRWQGFVVSAKTILNH